MKLKDFIEEATKNNPVQVLQTATKLIELQSITQYLELMYGVEMDIEVKPAPRPEGRYYGKGVIEELFEKAVSDEQSEGILCPKGTKPMKEKKWAMRPPIDREFWTVIERIEYWLVTHSLGSMKLYCKWHNTILQEALDTIDLDTSNIKFTAVSGERSKD